MTIRQATQLFAKYGYDLDTQIVLDLDSITGLYYQFTLTKDSKEFTYRVPFYRLPENLERYFLNLAEVLKLFGRPVE